MTAAEAITSLQDRRRRLERMVIILFLLLLALSLCLGVTYGRYRTQLAAAEGCHAVVTLLERPPVTAPVIRHAYVPGTHVYQDFEQ